ncbi:histidine kinase 2 [Olea europaea subsp. europaea]|uniref:histidine kinase n=1 Tax=Olea europaea subsp. europaea TaxID=158383 RepID=A0A8S0SCC7_OLEEU|nr:histidine kinase 2 [Olea europaea subsp. europaea]
MSSNCKNCSANGKLCSSIKQKKAWESFHRTADGRKWKRVVVFLWLMVAVGGFFWVLTSSNGGNSKWRKKISVSSDFKAKVLLEYCNVSKEEFHALDALFTERDRVASLAYCRESGFEMPTNCNITCGLKIHSSQMLEKWHKMVAKNVESNAHCPTRDESILTFFGLPFSKDKTVSFIPQLGFLSISSNVLFCRKNELQMTEFRDHATYNCDSISFGLVKICLWILVGLIISFNVPKVYEKFSSQKHEIILEAPCAQQTQLLQQSQSSSRSTGKWRKKMFIVFVLAGVVFSMWLFLYLSEDIILRRKETLGSMCDERARMLQDQFNVSMNHVHALALLVSTFHHGKQPSAIDQKTFEDYTERTAFERPLTSGVAYALRVRHLEREKFEQQQGWAIKKMETEDQTLAQDCNLENFSTSPVQEEYAPVIFSQKTVSHIVSIDMMSGKEDRENILRARASGKGVLTSPFKLLKSNHLGVVLTFAVYNTHLPPDAMPEQRINATVGYLGASYDVPSLVAKLLHQLASKQTIVVNVYDTTNKLAPIKMYGTDEIATGLLHISNLDFGDPTRKHEMHCRFKHKPPPPWQAITASVGILVITLLLGHIFHAAINRIAKVERGYREMMELKHLAEAADVAKSQFLATVSHEIRTPMNGVLGMLQMLIDTNLDARQLDYAQTAHASGKDLISLINKVLDQAKIESGRLELEAVPFDLRAVLDKVLLLFSGISQEQGLELAVYVSDQVPEVVIGDQERFGQIITNLVGNSIKFTQDKGHIFVSVHLANEVMLPLDMRDEVLRQSLTIVRVGSNASYDTLSGFRAVDRWRSCENFKIFSGIPEETEKIKLLVTVEDTGAGIPPEAQSRIFTPFMQADSSTSRKYGGTGIGLSISKRLVELMDGEIGFVSELNIGSTFSFTVTFTNAEANYLESMRLQCDQAVPEFRGLKALVVDERRVRAWVTGYHLKRLGMSVDITFSMESALSYLSCYSKSSFSVYGVLENLAMVLIDQDIWDKDICFRFHNLLKTIKQNGSINNSGIPLKIFLLATCTSSSERKELKLDRLVDNVITKPLRLSALAFTFQEATGFGKTEHNTRAKPSTLRTLLRAKQILVVDDTSVNRRVAEGALKKYGAVVTCVEGGKVAVGLLKPPHKFDACFMDLQMPGMDGFEATREIRSLESEYNEKIDSGEVSVDMSENLVHWHTPILAMTADVIQATNEECMKCGMDDYVSKPFDEGQLYSAVARFFGTE